MNDNKLRIERIRKAIDKIRTYLTGKSFDDLAEDDLLHDAVLMELLLSKDNFYLSGAGQTAIVYYCIAFKGAIGSVGGEGLVLNENGLGTFYINKAASEAGKNKWLNMMTVELKRRYKEWQEKWIPFDDELYGIATETKQSWREAWLRLDEISELFWRDSYSLDTIDPFAEELEEKVRQGLVTGGVDVALLHELISPAIPTLPQQILRELLLVKQGEAEAETIARKYWFKLGTWNGGKVLSADEVQAEVESLGALDELTDALEKRRRLQDKMDRLLDEDSRQLVALLRILTLWREERKSVLQRLSLGYNLVTDKAAAALGVEKEAMKWAKIGEVELAACNPRAFMDRKYSSVYIYRSGDPDSNIVTGSEAREIINSFKQIAAVSSLKGIVASPGKVSGMVRVILREGEFHRFQEGEVLVTSMTRPEYIPLMRKAKAIVTDEGGLTSHAAIVSRELKVPCVIGTKTATQVLKDGDMVEVDAEKGIVKIL